MKAAQVVPFIDHRKQYLNRFGLAGLKCLADLKVFFGDIFVRDEAPHAAEDVVLPV